MANPQPTLLDDEVGKIQPCSLEAAIAYSYDVSRDVLWVFHEDKQQLRMHPCSVENTWKHIWFCGGIRLVRKDGTRYQAMAMDFTKDDPIEAYNRAMAIIKK